MTPRQKAKAAGQPTYQGRPCLHGHLGIRRTANKHCVKCDLDRRKPPKVSSGIRHTAVHRSRKISTRQEAKAVGSFTYQGKPCPYGHSGVRRTHNACCVECYLARLKPRKVSSLQEARVAGRPTYQGKPCPHGHSGIRRTANKKCVECDKQAKRDCPEYNRLYRQAWLARPGNREKEKIRIQNRSIRNALQIAKQEAHRRAVNRNTLRLLYYDS